MWGRQGWEEPQWQVGSRRGPRAGPTLGGNLKTGGGAVWTFTCPMWGAGCPGARGRVEIRPEHRAGAPGKELRPQATSSLFRPTPHPPPENWTAGSSWSWMWARKGMPTGLRFRRCCTASSPAAPLPPTSPLPRDSSSDAWAQVSPSWSQGRPALVSQTHVRAPARSVSPPWALLVWPCTLVATGSPPPFESSPSIVVQSYLGLSNIRFLQRVPVRPGFCFSLY